MDLEHQQPFRFARECDPINLRRFDLNQPTIRRFGIMGFCRRLKQRQPIAAGRQRLANAPNHMSIRRIMPSWKQFFQFMRNTIKSFYFFPRPFPVSLLRSFPYFLQQNLFCKSAAFGCLVRPAPRSSSSNVHPRARTTACMTSKRSANSSRDLLSWYSANSSFSFWSRSRMLRLIGQRFTDTGLPVRLDDLRDTVTDQLMISFHRHLSAPQNLLVRRTEFILVDLIYRDPADVVVFQLLGVPSRMAAWTGSDAPSSPGIRGPRP